MIHPLIIEYQKLNIKSKKNDIIKAHINAENNYKVNNRRYIIDEYHHNLFKGYSTLRGYNIRFSKYNNESNLPYPYGTGILSAIIILSTIGCPKMARMASESLCNHPQSLMATDALISLMMTKNNKEAIKIVESDKELSKVCRGESSISKTNLDFLPDWCRHYLLVAFEAYHQPSYSILLSKPRYHTLGLVYHIVHESFHLPSSPTSDLNQQDIQDQTQAL